MKVSLPDAHDRELAVQDFLRNLVVTAGAGAGKTSLLVERILYAVLVRGIPLTRIVAITFTEKAAAELRSRLLAALAEVHRHLVDGPADGPADEPLSGEASRMLERFESGAGPDAALLRRRAEQALEPPHHLTTIHGFAAAILRRWPQRAGLSAELQIDDGTEWRQFVLESWPRVGREHFDQGAEAGPWRAVLEILDQGELRELVTQLGEQPGRPVRGDVSPALLAEIVRPMQQSLADVAARVEHSKRSKWKERVARHAAVWETLLSEGATAARQQLIEDPLLPSTLERSTEPPKAAEGIDRVAATTLLKRSQRMLRDLLQVDDAVCRDVLEPISRLADDLWLAFRQSGKITFQGLLAHARELVGRDPEVRRIEAERIDLFLLDEFQDTDPLQCELAFLLTADPESAGDDPWSLDLVPGKLFVVGDPKQSIYRFRGADLQIYHRACDRILAQGGRALSLSTNFRSRASLIAPLNTLFRDYFGERSRSEPGFQPMDAMRSGQGTADVEVWCVEPGAGGRVRDGRRAEGRLLADRIREAWDGGESLSDMAILLRSLENLSLYLRPLRELGIPCVVDGGRTFAERSEVSELYSILQAAADPQDQAAFLGALRSTLFHVPDPEIARFAETAEAFTWDAGRRQDDCPGVRTASDHLADWNGRLQREPAAAFVHSILQETALASISASAFEGAERLANQQKFAYLLEARLSTSEVSLSEALKDLARHLEFGPGEAERSLADERVEAVRILSIHKSKGLEYRTVYLPDMARNEMVPWDATPRYRWMRLQEGPAVGLHFPRSRMMNTAMLLQRQWDDEHQVAENKRLLYVAMTRARDRLVLITYQGARRQNWLRILEPVGFDPAQPREIPEELLEGSLRIQGFREAELRTEARSRVQRGADLAPAVRDWREAVRRLGNRPARRGRPSAAASHAAAARPRRRDHRADRLRGPKAPRHTLPPGAGGDGPSSPRGRRRRARRSLPRFAGRDHRRPGPRGERDPRFGGCTGPLRRALPGPPHRTRGSTAPAPRGQRVSRSHRLDLRGGRSHRHSRLQDRPCRIRPGPRRAIRPPVGSVRPRDSAGSRIGPAPGEGTAAAADRPAPSPRQRKPR